MIIRIIIVVMILMIAVYIPQRGLQWKQGVVIRMLLYTTLLYNTTPIHCTPLRLHPPVMNTQAPLTRTASAADLRAKKIYIYIYIYIYMYPELVRIWPEAGSCPGRAKSLDEGNPTGSELKLNLVSSYSQCLISI